MQTSAVGAVASMAAVADSTAAVAAGTVVVVVDIGKLTRNLKRSIRDGWRKRQPFSFCAPTSSI
jgi:hypothetical protein